MKLPRLRDASRWWSMRVSALGLLLLSLLAAAPDALLSIWQALPEELRAVLPAHVSAWVGPMLFAAAMIARVLPQAGSSADLVPVERDALASAGFIVDPSNGKVILGAVSQVGLDNLASRVTAVELALDAAVATVSLKAATPLLGGANGGR